MRRHEWLTIGLACALGGGAAVFAEGKDFSLRTGMERTESVEAADEEISTSVRNAPAAGPESQSENKAVIYWVEHGHKMMRAKEYEEAVYSFEQAIAVEPDHRGARFGLGTAYIQMGRYRYALDVLEPMTKEFPDDYTLKNNVAWLYATAADHSVRNGRKAIALAQDALLGSPYDYHVWSTLAEAYYVSGEYEKALRAAEEALRLAKEDKRSGKQDLREYQRQAVKCRKAAAAMSLIE